MHDTKYSGARSSAIGFVAQATHLQVAFTGLALAVFAVAAGARFLRV